jgi:branched-chain amino acid transport system substrate-binding protein
MEEQQASSEPAPAAAPKSKAMWVAVAVIIVAVVVLAAAVLGGLFAPGKSQLRIGTLLSLTGGLSLFGPGDTKAGNLAVDEINKAGGVLGQPVLIFNEDDQTNPTAAQAAATKLITQNHVNAIVGAQFSGGSLSAIKTAGDNGVVMVSPSATSVKLSDLGTTGGWFFRTISSDALQGAVAGSYLYSNASFRYATAFVINNPYGVGLGATFKAKFTALNGIVNDTIAIPEAQQDYTSYLTQLFDTNPQVVYFVAYPDTGLTVMKQWQEQRASHLGAWDKQWVFSEGLQDQVFVDQLRGVNVDVTKIWGTAPAAPVSSLYKDFVTRYKAAYFDQDPQLYASHTYDAVYLICLAAQKAGAVDGAAIKAQLRAVSGGTSSTGTVINGGQWAKALSTIAGGGAVNWEGASGTENLNATNDPAKGSYEVWGVNSTFKISRLAFFGEDLVQPAPPVMASAASVPSSGIPGAFLVQVRAPTVSRRA